LGLGMLVKTMKYLKKIMVCSVVMFFIFLVGCSLPIDEKNAAPVADENSTVEEPLPGLACESTADKTPVTCQFSPQSRFGKSWVKGIFKNPAQDCQESELDSMGDDLSVEVRAEGSLNQETKVPIFISLTDTEGGEPLVLTMKIQKGAAFNECLVEDILMRLGNEDGGTVAYQPVLGKVSLTELGDVLVGSYSLVFKTGTVEGRFMANDYAQTSPSGEDCLIHRPQGPLLCQAARPPLTFGLTKIHTVAGNIFDPENNCQDLNLAEFFQENSPVADIELKEEFSSTALVRVQIPIEGEEVFLTFDISNPGVAPCQTSQAQLHWRRQGQTELYNAYAGGVEMLQWVTVMADGLDESSTTHWIEGKYQFNFPVGTVTGEFHFEAY
jgi:hypothetical protein